MIEIQLDAGLSNVRQRDEDGGDGAPEQEGRRKKEEGRRSRDSRMLSELSERRNAMAATVMMVAFRNSLGHLRII